MTKYKVFKRSATNWDEFATARKTTIRRGLTIEEARRMCAEFNDNRTPAEEKRGTKLEFTVE
jgi:hypothetical protein